MVNIQNLPVELLKQIISFLDFEDHTSLLFLRNPEQNAKIGGRSLVREDMSDSGDDESAGDDDSSDLRNLCLVSRMFRELVQPLLFRYFDDYGLHGDVRRTVLFTKAIYRNPHLRERVHEIAILPMPHETCIPRRHDIDWVEPAKDAIMDLQLADQEQAWISAIQRLDLSVSGALLLNMAPNLRVLHLLGGQFSMDPLKHLFSMNPSLLSNLQVIWLQCNFQHTGYDIMAYEKILTLPSLAFPTFERGDLADDTYPSTWTPGTLATEFATFHHCQIDGSSLKRFMQACRKLKAFVYMNFSLNQRELRVPNFVETEFNASQAYEAALLHKDTLELFQLEYSRALWGSYSFEYGRMGSFRDFRVLNTIVIQQVLLPSHPQFPRSLKALLVTDCRVSIRDMIRNIAADCKKDFYPEFTDFKALAVDITGPIKPPGQHVPSDETPKQCFLELRNLFEGTKVNFYVVPYEISDIDELYDPYLDEDINDYYEELEDEENVTFEEMLMKVGIDMAHLGSGQIPGRFVDLMLNQALEGSDAPYFGPRSQSEDSWETEDSD